MNEIKSVSREIYIMKRMRIIIESIQYLRIKLLSVTKTVTMKEKRMILDTMNGSVVKLVELFFPCLFLYCLLFLLDDE